MTAPNAQTNGGPTSYEGSTSGPLGDLTVNVDGTFTFTPTLAARQYAETSGRVGRVTFFVRATDGDGNQTWVPVSIPLVPTGLPTENVYPPVPAEFMVSIDGFINPLDGQYPSGIFDIKAVRYGYLGKVPQYVVQNWKRVSSPLLQPDADTGLPVAADVYVVTLLRTPTIGTVPGPDYVVGFRKMELGDDITVLYEYQWEGVHIEEAVVAYMPGTFPEHLFKTRIPGVVGGNIFDNEMSADQTKYAQYTTGTYELELQLQEVTESQLQTHEALVTLAGTAGAAARVLYGGLLPPSAGQLVVLGARIVNGAVEVFSLSEEEKYQENYGGQYGLFYTQGPNVPDWESPQIGVPG